MIYLGSDHGGFSLKEKIKKYLTKRGYLWQDLGNQIYEEEDDYPRFAFLVAEKVAQEEKRGKEFPFPWVKRPKGLLFCRSAAGMVIAANKVKGIRAVAAFDKESAIHSRLHNDANLLALSGDWLNGKKVQEILEAWLTTEFSGEERHQRRLREIAQYESKIS